MNKSTTFLEALQNEETLDLRDNRGKHHDLCLILVEFIVALLCNRDGNLSSIRRHMSAHHSSLVKELSMEKVAQKKRYQDLIYPYY